MPTNRFRNVSGELIREKRMELGWTQDKFAAKLQLAGLSHIDRVMVAKIESQIRSIYDYELIVVAAVFQTTVDQLTPTAKEVKAKLRKLLPNLTTN